MQMLRVAPMGLNTDIDPIELAGTAYQDAESMVAKPGKMARSRGYVEVWPTPLFDPYWLLYTPQLGAQYWIYCGTDNVATVDTSGIHTDITAPPFVNSATKGGWTGGNLNGIPCFNNNENQPMYWASGNATVTVLPGLRPDITYNVLRPFKYHLIGLGYSDLTGTVGDGLQWSDAADPGQLPATWLPAEDNEAGDNVLGDENGRIVDGMALRDSFFIYKQDTVYEMSYIGGNEVFRFTKVFGSVGVLTTNCIVRVKGSHVVLGNGDIYRHDGQNMESICTGKVRDEFFSLIDNEAFATSYAVYDEKSEQVLFCVPTNGESRPNLALSWNASTGEFGYREIPAADYMASGIVADTASVDVSWDGDPNAWETDTTIWNAAPATFNTTEESVLMADSIQRKLYLAGASTQANGADYDSAVRVTGIDMGDPARVKAVRRLWPRVNVPANFDYTLTLYGQDRAGDPLQVLQTITGTAQDYGIPLDVNTRYFGFEYRTTQAVDWDVAGFDVEYELKGHY